MKNENWLKERERKEKICQDLFEHTTKNKEEIQKTKFQKHSKRNLFLKKLPIKEIGKHFFDDKEEIIPFFLRVVDSEKHKNKRKEERNDKKQTEPQKKNKKKSSKIEKEIRTLIF